MISLTENAMVLRIPTVVVALRMLVAHHSVLWIARRVALLVGIVIGILVGITKGCLWLNGVPLVLIIWLIYELLASIVYGVFMIVTIQVNVVLASHLSLTGLLVLNWFRSECRSFVLEVEIGAVGLDIVVVGCVFNDDILAKSFLLGCFVGNILVEGIFSREEHVEHFFTQIRM